MINRIVFDNQWTKPLTTEIDTTLIQTTTTNCSLVLMS